MNQSYLIVGLGNPGKEYENTRHNLGFRTTEELSRLLRIKLSLSFFTKGMMGQGKAGENRLTLLLPLNYMNHSGPVVKNVVTAEKIALENVLVVCDDMSLDFGKLRLKGRGSSGGHNGLNSLIEYLGTEEFPRLRMGIGQPLSSREAIDYVLEEFSKEELKQLPEFVEKAAQCCCVWINQGISKAMDQYNKSKG